MAGKLGVGTFVQESYEGNGDKMLDLFTPIIKEDTMQDGKEIEIFPTGVVTDTGPYDFVIPSDGNEFTAMPLTRLHGEIEVLKLDGGKVTDTEINAHVNLLPHSLFRQMELYVNGKQVADLSTPSYPFKAYIQTHLGTTDDAKKITYSPEMWSKDTITKENSFVLTGDTKSDTFVKRHARLKEGKIYFSIILHVDFLQCRNLLMPGVELKLRLVRNDDTFSLLGATLQTKIKIHKLHLTIRRVKLDPSISIGFEKSLQTQPAVYPIANSKIKTYTISSGIQSERISQIFRGTLPRQIIVGFVDSKAADGNINANPFVFEHFDNNYFNGYINGEPIIPRAFQPDPTNKNYWREYRWFLDNTACILSNQTHGITYNEFCTNSFFYVFDLSPDLCNSFHIHQPMAGTFDLQIAFKSALAKNITAIIYATFDEKILIDKDGEVVIEPM
jgi:hypothetical protein